MSNKILNRLIALLVFIATFFVYMRTLSVTVVFWDVGEFCAASHLLQVPHPPGSPLFVLIARVVSLVPFLTDIGARMHAVSAFGSALGISFLYLVAVKLISRFYDSISTLLDKMIVYGSSAIGAFALAFTTTYWDNSIEAEVYGLSMFIVAFIIWLALRWYERADEPHNERYMILIAYLLGLSTGVHLLSLLAVIPILMVVYLKRYELTRQSVIRFALISLGIFAVIYPGIVQYLPSMLDGEFKGVKSDLIPFIPLVLIIAAGYGVYRTIQTKQKMLHIACISFLLIVLGYTTYITVLIRANVPDIPMNENNPSNLERLSSYIGREQYGDVPMLKGESWDNDLQDYREKLFPRRHSHEPMHEPTRVNYSSDGDFLWRYQINHMFIRYVLWNFVGSEGDWQDAGVDWKQTLGIPFFLALIGIYYHFKKDWRMALIFMILFIIMGIVLDLYQNQQDPQPRERDYFYVGAYFTLALWIALGIVAVIDYIKHLFKTGISQNSAVVGVLSLGLLAVPVNLLKINWFEHDRSQNYTAWDYSYNLLQSCEPDAILFTNGDNDTFPLWYLQDVEGVRRDVRIVNLSLVNTSWYILKMKNEMPHGAKKVPVSIPDQQIERIQPIRWNTRQLDIAVPPDVAQKFGVTDTAVLNQGKITYTLAGYPVQQNLRILRVQDIMVRDIIMTNKWERPIHFAVTCSPDSKIGLDNFLWMRGLSWQLKPIRTTAPDGGLDLDVMEANVMAENVIPSKKPKEGFLYRNLNNPKVFYDENVQRLAMNYRAAFMRLTFDALRGNDMARARRYMDRMETTIPLNVIKIREWSFVAKIMEIFNQVGDSARFELYARDVEKTCTDLINSNIAETSSEDNPYRYLLEIYETRKDYPAALDLMNRLVILYPNDPTVKNRIQYYEQQINSRSKPDTSHNKQ